MDLNEKIDKLLTDDEISWKQMEYEIISTLAYKYNVGFSNAWTVFTSYLMYFYDNKIWFDGLNDIFDILLLKYIDVDCINYIIDEYSEKFATKLYDISEDELEMIKKYDDEEKINELRRKRIEKELLLPYDGKKFIINWDKEKMIERWREYLSSFLTNAELSNGNFQIEKISKLSADINEQSVKVLLEQQNMSIDDYAVIEVTPIFNSLPVVLCYKTGKDWKAGRYVFDKVFAINTTSDGKLIPSKINCDTDYVLSIILKELKCKNGDVNYYFEVFGCLRIVPVPIENIPQKFLNEFNYKLKVYSDPYKAFKFIIDKIIKECVLFKEFDFATKEQIGPAHLLLNEQYQEIMDTAKFEKNDFFREIKWIKAKCFNEDLQIKKISFDPLTQEYTFTCFLNDEIKYHLEENTPIGKWIQNNDECFIKNKNLNVKIKNASSLLPYSWWEFAENETKTFKILKQSFLLNVCLVPTDKENEFKNVFSFNTRYF